MKIYLSPSSQTANAYAYGGTTEALVCQEIGKLARDYFGDNGYEVIAGIGGTIQERVADSNAFGADYHVCIHTNAGGGHGTTVFTSTKCKNNQYAKAVYEEVAQTTPTGDRGMKVNDGLYEIKNTKANCIYVEAEFHDNPDTAKWIMEHKDDLAKAIVRAFCKVDGKTPTFDQTTLYYRVQCGAFKNEDYAERLMMDIKAKGYDAYVKYDGNYYRVQCGAFTNKDYAEALKNKLMADGYECYIKH